MRRTDREITDKSEMQDVLERAMIVRLALVDSGEPYVVPMHFGYRDGCLFLHSAGDGRKIKALAKSPRVCFEATTDYEILPGKTTACQWAARFKSVIGYGRVVFITDAAERRRALDVIMDHYAGKVAHQYEDKYMDRIAVLEVRIESMTGKKSGF